MGKSLSSEEVEKEYQDIIKNIDMKPEGKTTPKMKKNKKIKIILSIDGGGVRGLIPLRFLRRLEQSMKKKIPNFSIRQAFDLFAGCSAGAIICSFFAYHKLDCAKAEEEYIEGLEVIFGRPLSVFKGGFINKPKYDGVDKTQQFAKFLKGKNLSSCEPDCHMMFVTYDCVRRQPCILKSFKEDHMKIPALKALDATTAAPCYFPAIEIDKKMLIDGGVVANNPSFCAFAEAKNMWKEDDGYEVFIVSLGSGSTDHKISLKDTKKYGLFDWFLKGDLFGIVLDNADVVDVQMQLLMGENFMRVDSDKLKEVGVSFKMDKITDEQVKKLQKVGDDLYDELGSKVEKILLRKFAPEIETIKKKE